MSNQAGCRILVISPTAARAHQFVERVQALSPPPRPRPGDDADGAGEREASSDPPAAAISTSGQDEHGRTQAAGVRDPPAAGTRIPWTITNRYYTADVHFEAHAFEHFRVQHAVGVPAIIYVWGPGEAYREHVPEIAQKVQHYDPEVSLAVRFGESVETASPTKPTVDDDGLDEFLSSHGFEFVEGDRSFRRPIQDTNRRSDDEDSGIPGLPRVIDALSTIMWPSIVQSEATKKRKSRARDLIGWALEEEGDDGLRALIANPPTSVSADQGDSVAAAAAARKSRMQREMEELERWLGDEETAAGLKYGRGKPEGEQTERAVAASANAEDEEARIWVTSPPVSSAEGWEDMMTPPAIRTPRPSDEHSDDGASEHGFEDDFADFVSASPHPHSHPHLHLRPRRSTDEKLLEVNYDVGRLTPMHTGMSYRSLGSVSDFGGDGDESFGAEGHGYGSLDIDEDDPDLPSRAEILATSRRLFGVSALSPAPTSSALSELDVTPTRETSSITQPAMVQPLLQPPASADLSMDAAFESDDADESFAAFDLSRVLSALQGMKDEIAGMENEDERRRAAARVALGLVYGLGAGGDQEQAIPATVGERGGGA